VEGERSPGRELLTIDDVARVAGVSRSTVSLVLRNSPLVAEATNRKVREAIDKLGYVYNRKAAIRARLSHLIGIVIPDLSNPFFSEMTAGIDEVLNESGWVSLVGNSWDSAAKQGLIVQRMQEHKVDALIICPAVDSPPGLVRTLTGNGLAVLEVMRRLDPTMEHYLGIDYEQGIGLAVDHLAGLGHRAIVFLGGEMQHSAAAERRSGFEAAMLRHGLAPQYKPCPLTRAGAAVAVAELYAGAERPTALVCFNDVVAMGAMAGLDRLGLRVGKDVSVVGFDNVAESAFVRPPLSTIDSSARQLGMEAGRRMLDSIRKNARDTAGAKMPTQLVLRESTGPAPAALA
jgi:LacI family transcriptional regulator